MEPFFPFAPLVISSLENAGCHLCRPSQSLTRFHTVSGLALMVMLWSTVSVGRLAAAIADTGRNNARASTANHFVAFIGTSAGWLEKFRAASIQSGEVSIVAGHPASFLRT